MASHTSIRTMRTLGTCGCLLALSLACDPKPSRKAEAGGVPASGAPGADPAVSRGEGEANRMKGVAPLVTAGSEGVTASVERVEGGRYAWSVEGGEITAGAAEPEVTYRVSGAAPLVRLICRFTDAQGREYVATAGQGVVAAPVLERFEAVPTTVTAGQPVVLQWAAREIRTLALDPGGQDVTATATVQVSPTETTTYTLTGTNLAGTTRTRQVTVTVTGAPEILALGASGAMAPGKVVTLKAEFAHGRAELLEGGTVLGASEQSPLQVPVTLKEGLSVTLKVTGEAGASVTQTWSFQKAPK